MKFTNILKTLILEASRSGILYDKYVKPSDKTKKGVMSFDDFLQLIHADPTTRPEDINLEAVSVNDLEDIHPGKYSQWILKNFKGDKYHSEEGFEKDTEQYKREFREFQRLFLEDLPRLKDLLIKFDRFKGSLKDPAKKNIDNVSSIEELANLQIVVTSDGQTTDLESYRGKKVKKEKGAEVNKNYRVPGSEILQVGSEYTLIRISDTGELGSSAASFFGGYDGKIERGETNWCTAARGSSYSHTYRGQGPLYIFMANDDKGQVGEVTGLPTERYQMHFPSGQFRNRRNEQIDFVDELLNGKFKEFKDKMKPEFARGVTVGGTIFKVDSFTSGSVGKFIALYGMDDLFSSLPDELEEFQIFNRDRNNVIVRIPEDIGRFKQLRGLILDNCISEIPESVCQLPKLRFLSLTNNVELKTVPACLVNISTLSFINLKGSPNVEVPQEIKDRAEDVAGVGMWDMD